MTVWNLQTLNALRERIEADAASRIAKRADKIADGRFTMQHGRTPQGFAAWSNDPASRIAEYGDGVTPSDPWAHRAIREGVGRGRDE